MNTWFRSRETLLFTALIVIHVVPLGVFTYFPSQDGPSHIANAEILRDYHRPDVTVLRQYYVIDYSPEPNWLGHLVLAGLMVVVPPLVAEKIFLSVYVILFPLAVRYALRSIRPEAGFLAFLAFPFIYSFPFHMGFFYFSYSVAVFFFLLGYWLKYQGNLTVRNTAVLLLLWLLLFFSHPVSLVMACVALAILLSWLTVADVVAEKRKPKPDVRGVTRRLARRALATLIAALPGLTLMAMFLLRQGTSTAGGPDASGSVKDFLMLKSLVSYDAREGWFSTALAVLFLALTVWTLASRERSTRFDGANGLFLVAAACTLPYFLAPRSMAGGGYLPPRLMLYPYLLLILVFGAHSWPRIVKRGALVLATGITLVMLGLHAYKYAQINDQLCEYTSGAGVIESNTTFLPICFSLWGSTPDGRPLSTRVAPFANAGGYIAAQRRAIDLSNYECRAPAFPVRFRSDSRVVPYIGTPRVGRRRGPIVRFFPPPPHSVGRVDYVLVWGIQSERADPVEAEIVLGQLADGFDLIYSSPKRGLMQLYRRKDW